MKRLLQSYCSIVDKSVKLLGIGASFLIPVLAFVVFFGTIARYAFNAPPIWTYDLALFLFAYIGALGGAYAHQRKAHINVDIFYLKAPAKVKVIFNLISYSLAIFFLVIVVFLSVIKFNEAIKFNYHRQSEWAPPMHHFWIMFSFASLFFILQLLKDIICGIYFLVTGAELLQEVPKNGD